MQIQGFECSPIAPLKFEIKKKLKIIFWKYREGVLKIFLSIAISSGVLLKNRKFSKLSHPQVAFSSFSPTENRTIQNRRKCFFLLWYRTPVRGFVVLCQFGPCNSPSPKCLANYLPCRDRGGNFAKSLLK